MSQNKSNREGDRGSAVISEFRVVLGLIENLFGPPLGNKSKLAKFSRDMSEVLAKVSHLPPEKIISALEHIEQKKSPNNDVPIRKDDGSYAGLRLDAIEKIVNDPDTTRNKLLTIAQQRFGVSTGTLSRLSRDGLVDKFKTLIMNERSHEALARMASSDPSNNALMSQSGPYAESAPKKKSTIKLDDESGQQQIELAARDDGGLKPRRE